MEIVTQVKKKTNDMNIPTNDGSISNRGLSARGQEGDSAR